MGVESKEKSAGLAMDGEEEVEGGPTTLEGLGQEDTMPPDKRTDAKSKGQVSGASELLRSDWKQSPG